MDKNGFGVEINLSDLKKVEELNLESFDQSMFLSVWIMSGWDYLASIKGIGFKKAYKYLCQSNGDIKSALQKIKAKGLTVPKDYYENFEKAFLTFNFQVVYCPLDQKLKHLNDPNKSIHGDSLKEQDDISFLGDFIDEETFKQIVVGDLDPITHNKLKLDAKVETMIHEVSKLKLKSKREVSSKRRWANKAAFQGKRVGIKAFFQTVATSSSRKDFTKRPPLKPIVFQNSPRDQPKTQYKCLNDVAYKREIKKTNKTDISKLNWEPQIISVITDGPVYSKYFQLSSDAMIKDSSDSTGFTEKKSEGDNQTLE